VFEVRWLQLVGGVCCVRGQMMQQQFQQLGIMDTTSHGTQAAVVTTLPPQPVSRTQLPLSTTACQSEHVLSAVTSSPTATVSPGVSACHSQDSLHSYTSNESVAAGGGTVPADAAVPADGCGGSVRRHMVRRTLYRLVHQHSLISSFGEEDIPEVGPCYIKGSTTVGRATLR